MQIPVCHVTCSAEDSGGVQAHGWTEPQILETLSALRQRNSPWLKETHQVAPAMVHSQV